MRLQVLARLGGWIVLGLTITLAGAAFTSGNELVLYDNFETSRIQPDKWFGSETRRPNSLTEASRFVADGKLHLSAVAYGGMRSNKGRRTGSFGLGVKTSRPITALQAELTVTSAMAQTCPENTLSTQARAQLVGFFFNDGSRSAKGDLSGDVVALIEKVADSKDGNFIRALVLRCTSWSCSKGDLIKALLFTHKWTLSEPNVMRIEWKPETTQFVFTLNPGGSTEETRRIAYDKAIGPLKPPTQQKQRVRVRHHGANCKSGRRGVLINVAVDDVQLRFLDSKTTAALSSQSLATVTPPEGETTSTSRREVSRSETE